MQALNGIIDLCYNEPFLRDLFFELSGVNILQEVHTSSDTDHLLSSSRKALLFLSDAQVSSLFSELRYRPGVTEKQYTELTGHLLLVFFFHSDFPTYQRVLQRSLLVFHRTPLPCGSSLPPWRPCAHSNQVAVTVC